MPLKRVKKTDKTAFQSISEEIDIPISTAIIVIGLHLIVLFFPLFLSWVLYRYHDYVQEVVTYPFLLHVAVGLIYISNAFEIAQNTIDRWYYIGTYHAFCNVLFFVLMTAAMFFIAIAFAGYLSIITVSIAAAALILTPILYFSNIPAWPTLMVETILACYAWYLGFGDPLIFIFIVLSTVSGIFIYNLIVKTHEQLLHALFLMVQTTGFLFFPWIIYNRATGGEPFSWWSVIAIAVVIYALVAIFYKPLSRLKATPHRFEPEI